MDQSSPNFFSSNAGGIAIVCNVGRFWISSAVPEILAVKVGSGPKLTEILHVFGPQFFGGAPPEFLEWDYKSRPDSDHVAKFQGDQSRELGERVAKKKHLRQNISLSGTVVPGGLITVKCTFCNVPS